MNDEAAAWLSYADENLESAKVLLENGLLNPSLHNAQQAVEKFLKALLSNSVITFRKTHSISELHGLLPRHQLDSGLTEEECDLFDSIYLPSKYPLAGVLPDFEPTVEINQTCLNIATRVSGSVRSQVK